MGTVKYFELDGLKMYDVAQALRDSGWGIDLQNLGAARGLLLSDRNDPDHQVTVKTIEHDRTIQMYFVSFVEGGWLCLDHAIDQFQRVIQPEQPGSS